MSDDKIKAIYEARLKAWADANDLPVQFENERFEPPSAALPEDNIYLQGFQLPASTTSADLAGAHRGYRGVFQINVVIPTGIGTGLATPIRAALADLFSTNLPLTDASGFTVQIVGPLSSGPSLGGDTRLTIPLSFPYRADVT